MLELGGKSPNIVFADADLEAGEAGILAGIFAAAGQTCVAGSRALVGSRDLRRVVERVARRANAIRLGDPMDDDTQMGPIAVLRKLASVERMVAEARSDGAKVVTGGARGQVDGLPAGLLPPDDRQRHRPRAGSPRRRCSGRC